MVVPIPYTDAALCGHAWLPLHQRRMTCTWRSGSPGRVPSFLHSHTALGGRVPPLMAQECDVSSLGPSNAVRSQDRAGPCPLPPAQPQGGRDSVMPSPPGAGRAGSRASWGEAAPEQMLLPQVPRGCDAGHMDTPGAAGPGIQVHLDGWPGVRAHAPGEPRAWGGHRTCSPCSCRGDEEGVPGAAGTECHLCPEGSSDEASEGRGLRAPRRPCCLGSLD